MIVTVFAKSDKGVYLHVPSEHLASGNEFLTRVPKTKGAFKHSRGAEYGTTLAVSTYCFLSVCHIFSFNISWHGETKLFPHITFKTHWNPPQFHNFDTRLPLATSCCFCPTTRSVLASGVQRMMGTYRPMKTVVPSFLCSAEYNRKKTLFARRTYCLKPSYAPLHVILWKWWYCYILIILTWFSHSYIINSFVTERFRSMTHRPCVSLAAMLTGVITILLYIFF